MSASPTHTQNRQDEIGPSLRSKFTASPHRPKLMDNLRLMIRARHYSKRTEQTYCQWVRRYIYFHNVTHPAKMVEPEINAFLTHLTVKQKVSASTQNQALAALLFLYCHVLKREVGELSDVIRARMPKRVPVIMIREEVKAVLAQLDGDKWLTASLMYVAGLRLIECLRLRVQDIDFGRNEIMDRDGKGAKDRITMLPESLKKTLQNHLVRIKTIHQQDLKDGWGGDRYPMRFIANIPMPRGSGAGSGCFLRKTDGKIQKPARKDLIPTLSG